MELDKVVSLRTAPDWVFRYVLARRRGDYRPFPEQASGMHISDIPDAPITDRVAWVQADEYLEATPVDDSDAP